jgi:hypothetical protein
MRLAAAHQQLSDEIDPEFEQLRRPSGALDRLSSDSLWRDDSSTRVDWSVDRATACESGWIVRDGRRCSYRIHL